MHLAYKYGEVFKRGDLPFKIEFYSDITASATEALNNQQNLRAQHQSTLGFNSSKSWIWMKRQTKSLLLIDWALMITKLRKLRLHWLE
jgi:hypothetical protein